MISSRTAIFTVGFLQWALAGHLYAATGFLVDDGRATEKSAVSATITLEDDGVPSDLGENDRQHSVQVAAAGNASTSGCRTINGVASIYGLNQGSGDSSNQELAGGGRLNVKAYTAAMLNVPLHKVVEVTHNGHTIHVTVNDRGPYVKGRIIDLTPAAAAGLGFSAGGSGTAHVSIKVCA